MNDTTGTYLLLMNIIFETLSEAMPDRCAATGDGQRSGARHRMGKRLRR